MHHYSGQPADVLHGAGGNESAWSGVTKATYGQNLEENLRALHQKLRQMSYRPQPVRRVEIQGGWHHTPPGD